MDASLVSPRNGADRNRKQCDDFGGRRGDALGQLSVIQLIGILIPLGLSRNVILRDNAVKLFGLSDW